jgi:hypothetical protein
MLRTTLSLGLALSGARAIEFGDIPSPFGKTSTCGERLFGDWDCHVEFPDGLPYVREAARILGIQGNAGLNVPGSLRQTWNFGALKEPESLLESGDIRFGVPDELIQRHSTRTRQTLYPNWIGLDISDAETNRLSLEPTCNEPTLLYQFLKNKYDPSDIYPYLGYCIDYFTSFCACKVKRKQNFFSGSTSLVESASEFVCNMPDVQSTSWNNIPWQKYQRMAWDGVVSKGGDELTLTSIASFAPPADCFEIFCRPPFNNFGAGKAVDFITTTLDNKANEDVFCANTCLFPNFSWRATATCSKKH